MFYSLDPAVAKHFTKVFEKWEGRGEGERTFFKKFFFLPA